MPFYLSQPAKGVVPTQPDRGEHHLSPPRFAQQELVQWLEGLTPEPWERCRIHADSLRPIRAVEIPKKQSRLVDGWREQFYNLLENGKLVILENTHNISRFKEKNTQHTFVSHI